MNQISIFLVRKYKKEVKMVSKIILERFAEQSKKFSIETLKVLGLTVI